MRASKWVALALALAVAVLLVFRFSGGAGTTEGEIKVALDTEVERLNPLTIKSPKTFTLSWQIFEGLLSLDAEGNIVPHLATEWSSKDNKTWRFTIRKGVRFHESRIFGTPDQSREVTAADVVSSYTAFCGADAYPAFLLTDILTGCADYNSGKAGTVSGIRQTGPMTVEMELTQPEPFFLHRLTTAWIAIFPKEALDAANRDTWGLSDVVGTGPFQLASNSESAVALSRNPYYWGGDSSGTVRSISFRVIKNDQARLDAIRNGSVDLMFLPPNLFPAALAPNGGLKDELASDLNLIKYGTFNSHMIGFNVGTLDDVHLRRAISLGIDRKAIIDTLFFGNAQISGGTVPLIMKGYETRISPTSLYDPARAKSELRLSSYDGKAIELVVHDQASSEQIGQLAQSQLKKVGIDITLTKVDFNTAITRMVQGDAPAFSMYFDYVFSAPELVLLNMFDSKKRPVPNFWQYANPAIDAELANLRNLGPNTSRAKSAQIEEAVVNDAPAAFLFQLDSLLLMRKDRTPVKVNAHGHFDFASIGAGER
jgi:ABC-type transport system substrate-binding protein